MRNKDLICPACGKNMKIIHLDEQNIDVDICLDGCGGIFLDNRELKKVDEPDEDITPILKAKEGKTFEAKNTETNRTCPLCGTPMVKNYTSQLKNVEIDECYNCGGKFLDNGELSLIRAEYSTEKERIDSFNKYAKTVIEKYAMEHSEERRFL